MMQRVLRRFSRIHFENCVYGLAVDGLDGSIEYLKVPLVSYL